MLGRRDDLSNLNNSSLFFRNLLSLHHVANSILFHFRQVFEILVENTDFSLQEILKFRQVCKLWNEAVDFLLVNKWKDKFEQ